MLFEDTGQQEQRLKRHLTAATDTVWKGWVFAIFGRAPVTFHCVTSVEHFQASTSKLTHQQVATAHTRRRQYIKMQGRGHICSDLGSINP